jgi:hypothetical protein
MEIYVDDETKLTLHGLQQYYIKLDESEKNRKLNDLLDALEFNQVRTYTMYPVHSLYTPCTLPVHPLRSSVDVDLMG